MGGYIAKRLALKRPVQCRYDHGLACVGHFLAERDQVGEELTLNPERETNIDERSLKRKL